MLRANYTTNGTLAQTFLIPIEMMMKTQTTKLLKTTTSSQIKVRAKNYMWIVNQCSFNLDLTQCEKKKLLLANKSEWPILSNIEEWNQLQDYRFYQMKDKNIDMLSAWPMYRHPEGACLVSLLKNTEWRKINFCFRLIKISHVSFPTLNAIFCSFGIFSKMLY